MTPSNWWACCIAGGATAGVIARPFGWNEAVWAVAGAALLLALGLVPPADAWQAIGRGDDVYLFLVGMMLLSEVGRSEGLFDWAASLAVNRARGSPTRLFALVYAVGTVTTVLLSNDATAVVMTPAVLLVARRAGTRPLPLLLACAFIANAASFVLPISNPANLVLFGNHPPPLAGWLQRFALPSLVSIAATFVLLRWSQRGALQGRCKADLPQPPLTRSAAIALAGIVLTATVLLAVSAFDRPLGMPTAALGAGTALAVAVCRRASPWPAVRGVAWSVLPLVGGLFVLVEALDRAGVTRLLAQALQRAAAGNETLTAAAAGAVVAVAGNLMNNLPAGLIASAAVQQSQAGALVTDALLIGVDMGPNLSITGSLATILWLAAIRREGENVGFIDFLKVGAVVMPLSLALTLLARLLSGAA